MSETYGDGPIIDEAPPIVGRTYKVSPEGVLEPTPDPTPVMLSIRRSFRFLVATTVALAIVLGGVGFYSYTSTTAVREGVCNLRSDLEARVENSERIVRDTPEAIEKFGFTVSQVQKEISNQRQTLDALKHISCP